MNLNSLVDRVLEEGDEIWVSDSGDREQTVYRDHAIYGDSVRLETDDGVYRVSDSGIHYGDFGLSGDTEEGLYSAVQDYGLDGENVKDMLRLGKNAADKVRDRSPERRKVVAH